MEKILSAAGIETSLEGCCALAAACRWRAAGGSGIPLVVLTGQRYDINLDKSWLTKCDVCQAEGYGEIEQFISQWHTVKQ